MKTNQKSEKVYTVGVGRVNFCNAKQVVATGKRAARWKYVNLYAPPGTRYSDTRCTDAHAWRIDRD